MKTIVIRLMAIGACAAALSAGLVFFDKGGRFGFSLKCLVVAGFVLAALGVLVEEIIDKRRQKQRVERKGQKAGFDWGMHYFRAFAILVIMATHYSGVFGYYTLVHVALTASTIYFLFISGYLCQYIDQRHRNTPVEYYKKKVLNVICPFLLFSVLFGMLKGLAGFNLGFLSQVLRGEVQGQYWYIPFVSFLFLASPAICRMGNAALLTTTAVSLFLFICFPFRPGGFPVAWPDTFYLYAYFTFFYVIGFFYCRFKESVDRIIRRYWHLFFVGAVFLLFILWKPGMIGLKHSGYDLIVALQRFMVMVCVLVGLGFLKDKKIWILDVLAKYSFTLYFLHFGLFAMNHRAHDLLIAHIPLPTFLSETLVFALFVFLMLLGAILFKTVFGKYSRSLMGS